MIIRSQNKRAIRNFNLISDLVISKDSKGDWEIIACYPYFAQNDCGFATIGTYSTEEKAIKVLDMIQKEYCRHYYGEGGPLTTMNHYVEPFAFIPPKVFQMPSDEEVEV